MVPFKPTILLSFIITVYMSPSIGEPGIGICEAIRKGQTGKQAEPWPEIGSSKYTYKRFLGMIPVYILYPFLEKLCSRKRNLNADVDRIRFSRRGRGFMPVIDDVTRTVLHYWPVEMHIPGYNYCGAGTKFYNRLQRGDPGINKLDEACKEHDFAYAVHSKPNDLSVADRILACKAWERMHSKDCGHQEKAAAFVVASVMYINLKVKTVGSSLIDSLLPWQVGSVRRKSRSGS